MKKKTKKGFVCITDFTWHMDDDGGDIHGIRVFNTLKDLQREYKCVKTCGAYEIEMKVKKVAKTKKAGKL